MPRTSEGSKLIDVANDLLNQQEMHFVAKQNRYMIRMGTTWVPTQQAAMKAYIPGFDKPLQAALAIAMQDRGWIHKDMTYSFRPNLSTELFNRMDWSGWVQPIEGQHHWLFDVLMSSLGGGKSENIAHLEHVIWTKYVEPQNYLLPCILIYGEGGLGKNILVDMLLRTIFDGQTVSARASYILGQFNTLCVGKTVVMIEEAVAEETNRNVLKATLMKEKFYANDKGVIHYEVDNTPIYFISSNESDGGIWLDRSDADRRISVIHVAKYQNLTLKHWIARQLNSTVNGAVAWMQTNLANILTDPTEVGRWLNYLMNKYYALPPPTALHGEDFQRLIQVQTPFQELFAKAVFNDPGFTHISKETLYRGYRICAADHGYKPLGSQRFHNLVSLWLAVHHPGFKEHQLEMDNGTKVTYPKHYTVPEVSRRSHGCNDEEYIREENHRSKWIGPEL